MQWYWSVGPPHDRHELQQYWCYIGKFAASLSEREERATVQISLFVDEKEAFFLIPSKSSIESEQASCTSCLEKQPLTSMFAMNFRLKAAFRLSWSPLSFLLVCCSLPVNTQYVMYAMLAGRKCWRRQFQTEYVQWPWAETTLRSSNLSDTYLRLLYGR